MLRPKIYDEFVCTAEACKFTCCEGWEIDLEGKAQNDLEGEEKRCPFLNAQNLCDLQLEGKEIPSVCRSFPRVIEKEQKSLSLGCPQALDLLEKYGAVFYDSDQETIEEASKQKIEIPRDNVKELCTDHRQILLELLEKREYPLQLRLLLMHDYLLSIYDEDAEEVRPQNEYLEEENLSEVASSLEDAFSDSKETCMELSELFQDLVENYQYVERYRPLFMHLNTFLDGKKAQSSYKNWDNFSRKFNQEEAFLEDVIALKIFENLIGENVDDLTFAMQMIMMEFVCTKYACFLQTMYSGEAMSKELLKKYMVAFTRIISHNPEGFAEFCEEGFEDAYLDQGYMVLLLS